MNKSNFIIRWIVIVFVNISVVLLTVLRQIIGYGTSPKIDASHSGNIQKLVEETVATYNREYILELGVISIFIFLINLYLFKKFGKKIRNSVVLTILYILLTIISLMLISNRFRALNL